MDKGTISTLVIVIAMLAYVIIHFTLWHKENHPRQ